MILSYGEEIADGDLVPKNPGVGMTKERLTFVEEVEDDEIIDDENLPDYDDGRRNRFR